MRCLNQSVGLLFVCLLLSQDGLGGEERPNPGEFLVGVARIDITPETPVALQGYSSQHERISEGVHDRLYARAFVFQQDRKRLVLISCDVASFFATFNFFRKPLLERFKLQPDELYLAAVHTHSGPVILMNKLWPHPNNFAYTNRLIDRITLLVETALRNLQPAELAIGQGHSPISVSRREHTGDGKTVRLGRNPDAAIDREVLVMKIVRSDGSPLASFFNYPCHSRSLTSANRLISGDVLGIAEQFVERIQGGGHISAAFAGASGDIDPWYVAPTLRTEPGRISPTVLLGALLGEEVAQILARTTETGRPGRIRTTRERLRLPSRWETDASNPNSVKDVTIYAAAVGDIGILGLDCEVFNEIGKAIKDHSPFRDTFVITICNGGGGYLPTAAAFEEGGYEVDISPFRPDAAEIVIARSIALLKALKAKDGVRPN
jgi:neutral ceramidase